MFQMPISSPMIMMMLGCCCAAAGAPATITVTNNASRPSLMCVVILIMHSLHAVWAACPPATLRPNCYRGRPLPMWRLPPRRCDVRHGSILLQKSLMVCRNGDSVAVMRFAAEAGDDGAAEGGPRAIFLFVLRR